MNALSFPQIEMYLSDPKEEKKKNWVQFGSIKEARAWKKARQEKREAEAKNG